MNSKQVEFLVKLRDAAQMMADSANEYIDSLAPNVTNQEKSVALPGSTDLSQLPWKSYKTKQAAAPDEAAWIFADTQGAESLHATLKTKDRAQIGSFDYSLSGREKQFISRKPVKGGN